MYDYHNHTFHSDDSDSSIESMIEAGIQSGLKEMAITDHYDPDYPNPDLAFDLDFDAYFRVLEETSEKYKNDIRLIKGLEIGIQHGDTHRKCTEAINAHPYDFIIGSFHCAENEDLYAGNFFSGRTAVQNYRAYYEYIYNALKDYKDYDVIGHINGIDRYAPEIAPRSSYDDILDEVLKIIVSDSKGIEINTSSFRYRMGDRTTPMDWMVNRYVELGGEIVTTGSDAHKPHSVALKLDHAEAMIKNAGLDYLATFKKRKFVPIKIK